MLVPSTIRTLPIFSPSLFCLPSPPLLLLSAFLLIHSHLSFILDPLRTFRPTRVWGWWMLHLIDNLFPPHLPPRSLSLSSSSLSTSIWHFPLFSYSTAPSYISSPHLSLSLSLTYSLLLPLHHLISSHSTTFPSHTILPLTTLLSYLYRPCSLLPCTPLSTLHCLPR
ncbi:hypothetical protein BO83DRAFT_18655 [Aspergillus eucalypticola CBS 122712]|uniref:Uncharacterized protein n=1 Tax=Aspergillus eucalypticola (strain CBS 122712 / IBT 29274) TaxID=1448314 RepID=A0A317VKP4_ASPEC|nr:uncharacterized protein BO83DRAFT_18655 [Aspergillus eucalypticola CBS 122712]PWY74913.1 hypothetical protein BO83DRAFT_18655 [Aspergillus eucalypticola CBS 122712]